ncbi:hypothetical protein BHE74_00045949 [Ensete ventricosum]|nr:hypothetical protein BHE74_00045949 [Ensete ventricosum]
MAGMADGDEEEGRNCGGRSNRADKQRLRKAMARLVEEEDIGEEGQRLLRQPSEEQGGAIVAVRRVSSGSKEAMTGRVWLRLRRGGRWQRGAGNKGGCGCD